MTNPDGQPAEFNFTVSGKHYLLQQNWVNNAKKGHCAMDSSH